MRVLTQELFWGEEGVSLMTARIACFLSGGHSGRKANRTVDAFQHIKQSHILN